MDTLTKDEGFNKWLGDWQEMDRQATELAKLYQPYRDKLAEYGVEGNHEFDDYPKDHPSDGWKFHLNVSPEHVVEVSRFLKGKGFKHKFLTGGEVEDGKIFTVYTGSKKMTEKAIKAVYDSEGHLLETPKAEGEALFAPKIIGRFEGDANRFVRKACRNGVVMAIERADITDENTEYARKKLLEIYGNYFGGGIEYYDPAKIVGKDALLDAYFTGISRNVTAHGN